MKESLMHIVEDIINAVPVFERNNFRGIVARLHGDFNSRIATYWLTTGSRNVTMYGHDDAKAFGQIIPKNSRNAIDLLSNEVGTPINRGMSHFMMSNKADLVNRNISLIDDSHVYSYTNLSDFLNTLREKQWEIEENERRQKEQQRRIEELKQQENTQIERGILTKGLNKLKEEHRILTDQQEEMKNLTRYIRQQGKLRFNPIIDPVQTRIKAKNLFNGKTVIIDGGPGTGKTTTMIQRLKYLTDTFAIEEDLEQESRYYSLTRPQVNSLLNAIKENRDWMFFSPSRLLKEYLADAMNNEGLARTGEKVWHWNDFCKTVIRDYYHLFDPTDDKAPFKASKKKDPLFYQNSDVINAFDEYFVGQLRLIKNKFPKIDEAVKYKWTSIAINIKNRFESSETFNLSQFVTLLISLERTYGEECREILRENNSTLQSISEDLTVLLSQDEDKKNKIEEMLTVNTSDTTEDTDEDTDETEEDITNKITSLIKQWLRRYCYSRKNSDIRLSPRQEIISGILEPLLREEHKAKIDRIGELVLFEQFAKYARGVRPVLFGNFATKYKRFRRQALTSKAEGWNLELLNDLVNKRDGKELHPQEQSLLLGYINNMVKQIIKSGDANVNHSFVDAYNELSRPIIGVDEATDFSKYDIYAMQSFLTMDYNSMTLCGDVMQRLTQAGLTSWDEINDVVENPLVQSMRTSYRQSSALLDVAKNLYIDTIGEDPGYKSFMKSKKVPLPLEFVSDDEDDKVEWIEQRIKEVYIAYGKKLPSIAIFLNNKNDISDFVDALRETDFIDDTGIEVINGSEGNVLASKNNIRVYPIDVVKGMEFDVVFFHNIDKVSAGPDLVKRFIYVGVSRAAFFLGVTMSKEMPEIGKYLQKNKKWDKI